MRKTRVTRSSTKDENNNLMEFVFQPKNNPKQEIQNNQNKIKKSRNNKSIPSRQKSQQLFPNLSQIYHDNDNQPPNSNPISTKMIKNINKKKINKNQENQGIRILQQKQTQRIFRQLCNPDGMITVESLGRVMVRAKKQFQLQDLENMIAYYTTIKKKLNMNDEQKKENVQKKNKKQISEIRRIQLNNEAQIDEDVQQNFQDDLDQSQNQDDLIEEDPQQNWKTQLNYEQFKLIKKYFDK